MATGTCAPRIRPPFPGPPEHATKPTSVVIAFVPPLSSKAATQLASSPATAWWNVGALDRHATGLLPQCGAMRSSRRLWPLSNLRQKRGVHTRGASHFILNRKVGIEIQPKGGVDDYDSVNDARCEALTRALRDASANKRIYNRRILLTP